LTHALYQRYAHLQEQAWPSNASEHESWPPEGTKIRYTNITGLVNTVSTRLRPCFWQRQPYPEPETLVTVMSNLHGLLTQYGQNNKTIWDTEASWGKTTDDCFTDEDLQAAFLARFYMLHRSEGVHRFFWRAWIGGDGGLYDTGKGINKAGVAYQQIYNWIVGRTMMGACSANGTVWTCNFTGSQGYAAQAIWDTSETCSNGSCGIHPYTVGSRFVDYLTLDGGKTQIKNNNVPIGAKPIFMEN
jgi:hypothetical protein